MSQDSSAEPPTGRGDEGREGQLSPHVVWLCFGCIVGLVWWCGWNYLAGGAPFGDDNSSHMAWFVEVARSLRAGRTDFFFPHQNLGVPTFLAYQPLSGLLMGALHAWTAHWIAPWTLFKISLLVLWSIVPVAFYVGGRWLGLSRLSACLLGMLALLLSDPYDYGLTLETFVYRGLYTQLFGMVLLPLALGCLYRYLVDRRGSLAMPVLFVALAFLAHAFVGLFVGLCSGLLVLLAGRGWLRRLRQVVLVYGCVLVLIGWWLLPLLLHVSHVGGLPWKTPIQNGFLISEGAALLATGHLFDAGRWPWMTVLVGVGFASLVFQLRRPLARWILGVFALSFCLSMGPNGWGAWYRSLPLHGELNVMRYMMGLHMAGLLCAACGLGALIAWCVDWLGRRWSLGQPGLLASLCVVSALGALSQHASSTWPAKLKTFSLERYGFRDIAKELSREPGRRFAVDRRWGTTSHFHRDLLAMVSGRAQMTSYGMTFHATHGAFFAASFQPRTAHARLYNVGALVATKPLSPDARGDFREVFRAGRYRLYRAPGSFGYFGSFRPAMRVCGPMKAARPWLASWSPLWFAEGRLPLVGGCRERKLRYAGRVWRSTPLPMLWISRDGRQRVSWRGETPAAQPPRSVDWTAAVLARAKRRGPIEPMVISAQRHQANVFSCQVVNRDPSQLLLLKINYFPYWRATVDGKSEEIVRVAPNFMAIRVPVGAHRVRFVYRNPAYQKLWFVAACGCFLWLLAWLFLISARRRSPRP